MSTLRAALRAKPPGPDRAALAQLAETYAAKLDQPGADLLKLTPPYVEVLQMLGLAPGTGEVTTSERPASPLDEIRRRRAARVD